MHRMKHSTTETTRPLSIDRIVYRKQSRKAQLYSSAMVKLFVIIFASLSTSCSGIGILRKPVSITTTGSTTGRETQQALPSLDDIILSDPDLTTLAAAWKASGLKGRICATSGCNSTVFAPTNDAFDNFDQRNILRTLLTPKNFLKTLFTPNWIVHLQNLLAFHATEPNKNGKRLPSTDLVDGQSFTMLNREIVTVNDLKRGISLSTELTDNSNLIELDIIATNGMLHTIDTVLAPAYLTIDVFALGKRYQGFTILTELLESVGLVGIRSEFTVIAPTDAAFLALGNDVLAELRGDREMLRKLLLNHVIFGVFPSILLTNEQVVTALGGLNITFTISDDLSNDSIVTLPEPKVDFTAAQDVPVKVNGANVVFIDVLASNGIAHVVDRVLFDPDEFTSAPSTAPSGSPEKTSSPSKMPSRFPMATPSVTPSEAPSESPDDAPSTSPTDVPTNFPIATPSAAPSKAPSKSPEETPSSSPSESPSHAPIRVPIPAPVPIPTANPSSTPSGSPKRVPITVPVPVPKSAPIAIPTASPSSTPSGSPKRIPIPVQTPIPMIAPIAPATANPSSTPSGSPKRVPIATPLQVPVASPVQVPVATPVQVPIATPVQAPVASPMQVPIATPVQVPVASPVQAPVAAPIAPSTFVPSTTPSGSPKVASETTSDTDAPSTSLFSGANLSIAPSDVPSSVFSEVPSTIPSSVPSTELSFLPSSPTI